MPLRQIEGLILNQENFRENDRIFLIFSREEGKLELVGRGTRKATSKLAASLPVFSLVKVMYAKGRVFDQITAVEVIDNFPTLKKNFAGLSWLSLFADIIKSHVKSKFREREIFRLLVDLFSALNKIGENRPDDFRPAQLVLAGAFKLLAILGFRPELHHCLKCSEKIKPKGNYFSIPAGGLVCAKCQSEKEERMISTEVIKIIRYLLKENFSGIAKIKVEKKVREEVISLAFGYFPYVLEEELKSLDFLKKTT